MHHRHTVPPSAGRPSGMRPDHRDSHPPTNGLPREFVGAAPVSAGAATAEHAVATGIRPGARSARQLTSPSDDIAAPHRKSAAHAAQPPKSPSNDAAEPHPKSVRSAAAPHPRSPEHAARHAKSTERLPAPAAGRAPRTWRRRTVLRAAGAGVVAVPAVAVLASCAEDDTVHAPDPLAAHEVLARADAAAATAAIALAPQAQAALTTIATERTAHADALRAEIDRVIGVYGDGTTPVHRTGVVTVPGSDGMPVPAADLVSAARQPISVEQLRARLLHSQQAAATLARTESGYRAGLLASISAACATEAGVLLS
ncbi:hypothetical protein [Nocardia caishijiensis]|uniref:hypothetical protein n=1 Tax=Nocardia caishijiensis TaxID=184756 RepID=UPI001F1E0CC7|nr:hypothetical protein [Nocardia caishijiensis]